MLWFKILLTIYLGLNSILFIIKTLEDGTYVFGLALSLFFVAGIWVWL